MVSAGRWSVVRTPECAGGPGSKSHLFIDGLLLHEICEREKLETNPLEASAGVEDKRLHFCRIKVKGIYLARNMPECAVFIQEVTSIGRNNRGTHGRHFPGHL